MYKGTKFNFLTDSSSEEFNLKKILLSVLWRIKKDALKYKNFLTRQALKIFTNLPIAI